MKRPYTAEDSAKFLRPLGTLGIHNTGSSYPWGGCAVTDRWSQLLPDDIEDEDNYEGYTYGGHRLKRASQAAAESGSAGADSRIRAAFGLPQIDIRDYIGQRPPGRVRE